MVYFDNPTPSGWHSDDIIPSHMHSDRMSEENISGDMWCIEKPSNHCIHTSLYSPKTIARVMTMYVSAHTYILRHTGGHHQNKIEIKLAECISPMFSAIASIVENLHREGDEGRPKWLLPCEWLWTDRTWPRSFRLVPRFFFFLAKLNNISQPIFVVTR